MTILLVPFRKDNSRTQQSLETASLSCLFSNSEATHYMRVSGWGASNQAATMVIGQNYLQNRIILSEEILKDPSTVILQLMLERDKGGHVSASKYPYRVKSGENNRRITLSVSQSLRFDMSGRLNTP